MIQIDIQGKIIFMKTIFCILIPCILMPIYLLTIWFGSLYMLARQSGWTELAQKYRCNSPYDGTKRGWQWGRFNWIAYKGCLWLGMNAQGLYIEIGPGPFFNSFHPPLLIPWNAIKSVRECKYWWMRVLEFKLNDSDVKIQLRAKFLAEITPYLSSKMQSEQFIGD
jgi:hypothetical protein